MENKKNLNFKIDNMKNDCMFCDRELIKKEEVMRNKTCIFISSEGYNPEGVLVGAGLIIPIRHTPTPFSLTEE